MIYLKFNNKKVIILDLDGTLINSVPDLALAINHMLEHLERKVFSEEIIHGWVGNGALTLVKRALSGGSTIDKNLDKQVVENALDIFLTFYAKNLCHATGTYPNVSTTLHAIKEKGYRLAIVTNKPFLFVAPLLEHLELDHLFDFILGGDSLAEKKPSPLPLLHVCEKLNVTVDECIMVGDSKNDILAANACSMQSVGVSYGYNYGEDIGIYKPDIVLDDFKMLLHVL